MKLIFGKEKTISNKLKLTYKKRYIQNPSLTIMASFAAIILCGALLLCLAATSRTGEGMTFLDALFTATSCVCVTGLSVADPGTTFNIWGQLVMLFLIQGGGLGFMTIATGIISFRRKGISLRQRMLLKETFGNDALIDATNLTKRVLLFTLIFELIGAFLLFLAFLPSANWGKAAWYGIFHSISAFNNAGFDVLGNGNSLYAQQQNILLNLTMYFLIISGGLGFLTHSQLLSSFQQRKQYNSFSLSLKKNLSLQSKIILKTMLFLVFTGALTFLCLEYHNPTTIGDLSLGHKITTSFFQSITYRTAGFSTVNLAGAATASQFLAILFMFIGASPASTGGGIKTTTVFVLWLKLKATLQGDSDIHYQNRTIGTKTLSNAMTIIGLAGALVLFTTLLLTISEPRLPFMALLFEAVSAFSTTGLSLGITSELNSFSKGLLIASMFIGRVGLLTLLYAISDKDNPDNTLRYPTQELFVG